MTDATIPAVYESAFMKELHRQVKALDAYGAREGWDIERLFEPFFRKYPIEAGCTMDRAAMSRVSTFYQALAVLIEGECGQMVTPVININDEGFGRVLLIVGKLVILDKTVRDAGRFRFASPEAMQAEAEKVLAVAVSLIGKYSEVAKI